MASKDQAPRRGSKTRIIAVAVLSALALLNIGMLVMLRHGGQPPAPPPPAAPAPAPAVSMIAPPQFDVVRVDTEGNTVIAGRAAPGAVVTVKDNNSVIGTVDGRCPGGLRAGAADAARPRHA